MGSQSITSSEKGNRAAKHFISWIYETHRHLDSWSALRKPPEQSICEWAVIVTDFLKATVKQTLVLSWRILPAYAPLCLLPSESVLLQESLLLSQSLPNL
ncbi:MAG: hypothetical protein SO170_06210 [Butyribacter sp.]|nr:hypothetical protein [bacterium]MDY3854526.1 hypothetical protein [Butyribacter sp.]